jgi:N-carbamoyl-L-amino-acid hydrolase
VTLSINPERLLGRLHELGQIGRDGEGILARLAASDGDKAGRDALVQWMAEAELDVKTDAIGNIFGTYPSEASDDAPVMLGSHIDTVVNAGIYDGCYGVLAALEVVETLRENDYRPARPITVAAFTGEEGARFAPDMLGSLVHVGGLSIETALQTIGIDGTCLGDELTRIGYAGPTPVGTIRPHIYLELHVEQGPVLDHEGLQIGAVEGVQGISWQRIVIDGQANHAGTTPMHLRADAGAAAARISAFLHEYVTARNAPTVATVGSIRLEPDLINVVASRALLTVDIRDPEEDRLQQVEAALGNFLDRLRQEHKVTITTEALARFEPVVFDPRLVATIESIARNRGFRVKRMASGAGHDAQMMARICPAAMIFVPSVDGISHNPKELTADADIANGANVLLDTVLSLLEP